MPEGEEEEVVAASSTISGTSPETGIWRIVRGRDRSTMSIGIQAQYETVVTVAVIVIVAAVNVLLYCTVLLGYSVPQKPHI